MPWGAPHMLKDPDEQEYPPASILVVDDNPANLVALVAVLDRLGHRVVQASSGAAALERVREEDFAVVLLDVQMPVMDGYQTLKLLHQLPHGRNAPVVFMTALHNDMMATQRGYAAGAIDYIIKPFDPDLLRAKVNSLVSLYRRGAELKRRAEIIAQKEIEMARAHAEAVRADEASRLKDRFIGILGHDLRNPLTAISNSAHLLLRAADLPEKHHNSAARILRASERMAQMIRDVLDFTRGQLGGGIPIEPAQADLAEICSRVVDETKAVHPQREILLDTRGDLAGPWDKPRIEQVVSNLVGNAVHHGQGTILVEALGEDQRVVLRVRNGGPPIPAEDLPTLFEAFSRGPSVRRRTEGLGLGLYIVKEIVRAHGGTVEVKSNADEGTTFSCVWTRPASLLQLQASA
jgi:two-component system, sensor histidine kinase and response regulator